MIWHPDPQSPDWPATLFAHLSIHQPKPGCRDGVLASMAAMAAAAAGAPGLLAIGPWRDARSDRLVGLALWESQNAFNAAMPALLGARSDKESEDLEHHPPDGFRLTPARPQTLRKEAVSSQPPGGTTTISETTNLFLYKLICPRPSFATDQTPEEQAIMARHEQYWSGLAQQGYVLVFAPVADPDGVWGLAVVRAHTVADVQALSEHDPAITSGLTSCAVFAMPVAIAPAPTGEPSFAPDGP